ncbi:MULTISPECIES: hypothetical protein [unclassified Hyphomonas]|uniref:hypothetical protein n=1 Tax=unclassified Hyphomonas TaxID=2630699 RepID=UPI000458A4A4|nr:MULTISPECIES: hypothetical protein [unclassified Hyphomonas]KCZ47282.1 hypothetical protein HY17_18990 [Hyphomonas sp. CY54-11-8]
MMRRPSSVAEKFVLALGLAALVSSPVVSENAAPPEKTACRSGLEANRAKKIFS